MWNKDEIKSEQIPVTRQTRVREVATIDRKQVKAPTRQARDLMDVWVLERKELLARQLAANAEIKQRWLASNPIEISQRQRSYHTKAQGQTSQTPEGETSSEEDSLTDRRENEGGWIQPIRVVGDCLLNNGYPQSHTTRANLVLKG